MNRNLRKEESDFRLDITSKTFGHPMKPRSNASTRTLLAVKHVLTLKLIHSDSDASCQTAHLIKTAAVRNKRERFSHDKPDLIILSSSVSNFIERMIEPTHLFNNC